MRALSKATTPQATTRRPHAHLGPFLGKGYRSGFADARRSACDERHQTFKLPLSHGANFFGYSLE